MKPVHAFHELWTNHCNSWSSWCFVHGFHGACSWILWGRHSQIPWSPFIDSMPMRGIFQWTHYSSFGKAALQAADGMFSFLLPLQYCRTSPISAHSSHISSNVACWNNCRTDSEDTSWARAPRDREPGWRYFIPVQQCRQMTGGRLVEGFSAKKRGNKATTLRLNRYVYCLESHFWSVSYPFMLNSCKSQQSAK